MEKSELNLYFSQFYHVSKNYQTGNTRHIPTGMNKNIFLSLLTVTSRLRKVFYVS